MSKIKTIYVCNHAHTDIGFTDYQELALRQHGEFVGQALDLIEATDGYPVEAQYRWTVETTGPFLKYLRQASKAEIDRFRHWHEQGRIDIAGMQYNLTPLLNVEQMHRTLYPLRAIRDEFGFKVEAAMQDDVNGVSWLYRRSARRPRHQVLHRRHQPDPRRPAEALPRRLPLAGAERQAGAGLERLSLPVRPQPGRPRQLGSGRPAAAALDRRARERPTYPFDFLYCESTHPVRVDNGPPDAAHARFRQALERRGPALPDGVHHRHRFRPAAAKRSTANAIGTQRGDWTDHWADGVGSSAFEVGVNRAAHEIVGIGESARKLAPQPGRRATGTPHRADRHL